MVYSTSVFMLFGSASGHGMMSQPPPRASKGASFSAPYYASCAGYGCLWFSQGCSIGCDECTGTSEFGVNLCGSTKTATVNDPKYLTWNMDVEPLSADDWTQFNPWRAPGTAPVYDPCGMAGGGQKAGDPGNGGVPPPGHKVGDLGSRLAVLASGSTYYKPGSVVEVAWAIDANHGGGYQYRLCSKAESLTEECFMKTPLNFVGSTQTIRFINGSQVDIPATYLSEGVVPTGSTWARNPIPACGDTNEGGAQKTACTFPRFSPPLGSSTWGPDSYGLWGFGAGACESQLPGKTCTSEEEKQKELKFEIVDRVQIPSDLPEGEYHLGFRWDCEQTPQVWSSCADVTISSDPAPPSPPPSGKYKCQGIPYVTGQCVEDPAGIYGSEGACQLSCGMPLPPAPPPAPRPEPFSEECLSMLEEDCGKFTPHGEKTNAVNCNGCISYHAKDIVPLCGGWSPSEGGQADFQNWCKDKYVPPVPTPPSPPAPPSPGGCNDPTNACTGVCAPCKGVCESLKTSVCAQCWAVDPDLGTSCLSDGGSDCRQCWYPTPSPPAPSPPAPSPVPSPAPQPVPSPTQCPGGSLDACIELCPTSPDEVYTACCQNCGEKCSSPTPVPAPTPGGCNDPTGACTGVCASCEGTCETLKTGPCAACWEVDPTYGHACLSDDEGEHGDCRACWHQMTSFI